MSKNDKALAVQDEFFTEYVSLKPNGLGAVIVPGITYDNWQAAIGGFAEALKGYAGKKERALFALADLFNYGEDHFPEQYSQAYDSGIIDEKTLSNITYVARKIPATERHVSLSFSHHDVVAGIDDPKVREELLTTAETEKLPVSQLRKLRNEKYPSKKRQPKASPPKKQELEKLTDADAIARCDEIIDYLVRGWPVANVKQWQPRLKQLAALEHRLLRKPRK